LNQYTVFYINNPPQYIGGIPSILVHNKNIKKNTKKNINKFINHL